MKKPADKLKSTIWLAIREKSPPQYLPVKNAQVKKAMISHLTYKITVKLQFYES